ELVVLEVAGAGNVAAAAKPLTPTLSPQAGRGRAGPESKRVPSPRARGEGQVEGQVPTQPAVDVRPAGVVARRPGARPLASPAVRRRAWDLGVELQFVPGSGPHGRITQQDLDTYVAAPAAQSSTLARQRKDGVEEVPIIGLRRAI